MQILVKVIFFWFVLQWIKWSAVWWASLAFRSDALHKNKSSGKVLISVLSVAVSAAVCLQESESGESTTFQMSKSGKGKIKKSSYYLVTTNEERQDETFKYTRTSRFGIQSSNRFKLLYGVHSCWISNINSLVFELKVKIKL